MTDHDEDMDRLDDRDERAYYEQERRDRRFEQGSGALAVERARRDAARRGVKNTSQSPEVRAAKSLVRAAQNLEEWRRARGLVA